MQTVFQYICVSGIKNSIGYKLATGYFCFC